MEGEVEDKSSMGWMYQGVSSIVNREDYLTGKKVDKNFQLYAGEKGEGGETRFDILSLKQNAGETDSSVLDLETVKKEDPLVAIKVREEKIRREIVDNPIKMKRLQKIVASAMEKKMKKILKKQAKHHRRGSSRSSSSDSSDERKSRRAPKQSECRSHRRSYERLAQRSHRSERHVASDRKFDSDDRRSKQHRTSTGRSPIVSPPRKNRHDSETSTDNFPETKQPAKQDSIDYSGSDSEEERRKRKFSGYGLVKGPTKPHLSSAATSSKISSTSTSPPSNSSSTSKSDERKRKLDEPGKDSGIKKKLTPEEMEAKRLEMLRDNPLITLLRFACSEDL